MFTQNVPVYFKINTFQWKTEILLGNLLLQVKNILGAVRDALSASLSS